MKPLYPIMAVVAIASAGAFPLRARAADGETHPVNAMSKILAENPGAREDAAKRISDFLLNPGPDGKSFLKDGVDKKALGAVATEWGKTTGSAGSVANLYFVLGPGGAQPGWALKDPLLKKSFVTPNKWEGRLRTALADWTGKSQIDKTKEKGAVTAFLNDAADKASTVYADARSKKELDLDIESRNDPVNVPDTRNGSRAGSTLDGSMQQYSLEDLYKNGAAFGMVSGPQDDGGRQISIKIYSTRRDDGTIYNEIGIFDVTDNNDIFGQRFPLDAKTQSFVLDDRTAGHRKYELTFGVADASGNRTLKFGRPGGGQMIETSVAELLIKRADQAEQMGNIISVGGQDFYALPQGGAKSAIGLFPKSLIDNRTSQRDLRDLQPQLYAEVGSRGPDGRNLNVPPGPKGGPHLGKVGEKEYHLVWNTAAKVWEVKEGAGDLPEKPKPPTTGTGTGTGTGDPNNPGGGTGTTPDNTGSVSLDDLIKALFEKDPTCKLNPEDTKDLDPSLKTSFGLVVCNPVNPRTGRAEKRHIVLTPKSVADSQQLSYGDTEGQGQKFILQRSRLVGHYLVLQFDKQTQYLDLLTMEGGSFAMAGFVVDKTAKNFTDVTIFVDALRNYMGVTGKDTGAYTEVPKRLASTLKGRKLEGLTGTMTNTGLVVNVAAGGSTWNIWPEIVGADQAGPVSNAYQNINGPGTAMDADQGGVSSADAPFPDKQPIDQSQVLEKVKESSDIALYKMRDAKPERYFLMFKYEAVDDPKKPAGERKVIKVRQKQFEVFNEVSPLPNGYQMQGLVGVKDAVVKDRLQAAMRFVPGSSAGKGALIVVQNKALTGQNEQDAATNCAGPIVWWGVDRAAAETACKKNKL